MKTKLLIGLGLLFAGGLLLYYICQKHGTEYWSAGVSGPLDKIILSQLSNSWTIVAADGNEFRLFDRKTTQYYLLLKSSSNAFQELQSELQRRQKLQSPHETFDKSGFLYLPEGYGTILKDGQALKYADWWHPELQGSGILARINTNYNHMIVVVNIYAFNHATNALLFSHIQVIQ
jgi:hypothetical protein